MGWSRRVAVSVLVAAAVAGCSSVSYTRPPTTPAAEAAQSDPATAIPTARPAPANPNVQPSTVARVEISIPCHQLDDDVPIVQGDDVYVACAAAGSDYGQVLTVNASTGKVTLTLKLGRFGDLRAVDNGIWVDLQSACGGETACPSRYTDLLDPTTGAVKLHLPEQTVVGNDAGAVWLTNGADGLTRYETRSRAKSSIPFKYPQAVVACGSLFGVDRELHRVDPKTGTWLADIAGSADVAVLGEVDGACWARHISDGEHSFFRLGPTAVDFRSAYLSGHVAIADGAFWVMTDYGTPGHYLQQVDPFTGKWLGPRWQVPMATSLVAAGGKIWIIDADAGDALERLDISSAPLR